MDSKVKAYIDAGKKIKSLEELSMEAAKREKLISLGIFSKGKTVYSDDYNEEAGEPEWDEERKKWKYTEIIVPEVTDEEYAAILESEALQSGNEPSTPYEYTEESEAGTNSPRTRAAESYLGLCAGLNLVVAIITIITGAAIGIGDESWVPFIIGLIIANVFIAFWASLKVLCNISNNLHDINEKAHSSFLR